MAWPDAGVSTANLDAGTDSPAAARADLLDAVQKLNVIIAAYDTDPGLGVPAGTGFDYWGTTLPDGYLWADGSAVSRTTYARLFARFGTTYGAGDGSTTFNLPDKRGRVSVAADGTAGVLTSVRTLNTSASSNTVLVGTDSFGIAAGMYVYGSTVPAGARVGSITGEAGSRVVALASGAVFSAGTGVAVTFSPVDLAGLGGRGGAATHSMTVNEMPSHTHAVPQAMPAVTAPAGSINRASSNNPTQTAVVTDATGGSSAHNNLQPSIVCNYIIKF